MRRLLSAALLLALAAGAALPARADEAADDSRWDARLTSAKGEVVIHPADGSDAVPAEADTPLDEGDRVTTGAGSSAEIALDGESLITLAENSDFKLEKTDKSDSLFALTLGSLLAKIQKLGSQSLSVRSPSAVAAVRGTEFGVDVEGDQSHVGVFDEGRVEVKGGAGGSEVLAPNQETSVRRGQAPLKAHPLMRFIARRKMMRARIRRLQVLRQRWRRMPPSARKRRRLKALKRRVAAVRERKKAVNRKIKRLKKKRAQAAPPNRQAAPEKRP
jgi:hypothetical protein